MYIFLAAIISLALGAGLVFLYHRKVFGALSEELSGANSVIAARDLTVNELRVERATLSERANQVGRLELKLGELERTLAEKDDRISSLREEVARAEQEQDATRRTLEDAEKRFEATFNDLAVKAMNASAEQFLKLANEKFDGLSQNSRAELEKRQVAINELVKPLAEKLNQLDESTRKIEESEARHTARSPSRSSR